MAPDNDIQKELEEISPFLSRLPKVNPYTVPAGYFEQFPSSVLTEARQAKVLSITPKRTVWRLAVAAVIAGAVMIGGWIFVERRTPVDAVASVQKQIGRVSDAEMAAYVEGSGSLVIQSDDLSSSAPMKDEDVPLVLADVSDQELQQYVDQHAPSAKLN